MRFSIRLYGLVVSMLLVALVMAACGSTSNATPAATATTRPAATAAPTAAGSTAAATATPRPAATAAPTAAPTATPVPVPTGQLRYALSSVGTFNLMPQISAGVNRSHIDPLYDPMLGTDNMGAASDKTGFVSAWSFSPDGMVATFKVRSDVVFHNGDKATSQALKASLTWYASPEANGGNANNARVQAVQGIETPDPATLVLTFKTFDLFSLFNHLTIKSGFGAAVSAGYLLPDAYLQAKGYKEFDKSPVGSGPFKFRNALVDQEVNLEAMPKHWLYGVPRFQTVKVSIISEDGTRLALLKSGGAELADVPRPEGKNLAANFDVREKANSKNAKLLLTEQWIPTFKNGVKNPFADVRVRRAMNLAVDRTSVVRDIMGGYGRASMEMFVVPGDPGYVEYPIEKQDLAKAKALLAEAGYPNGFEMDFMWYPLPGVTVELPQYSEAVAVWWEQLGLKVNRMPTSVAAGLALWTKHDMARPMAINGWWSANFGFIRDRLSATQSIKSNLYRTTEDPGVEQVMKAAGAAKTMDEYIVTARAFQKYYIDQAIDIPLFSGGEMQAVKKGLGGDKWDLGKAGYNYNLSGLAAGKPDVAR